MSADIFGDQPSDPDLLAELYDLEHDEVTNDHVFYREMARRAGGVVLDLGCGSGRLFASFLSGGSRSVVGLDGSPALLRRAEARIAGDGVLQRAGEEGRLRLVAGDMRRLDATLSDSSRFNLVVAAGVLPHLDGPDAALAMLSGVRRLLAKDGIVVLDDIGPGSLPHRDLPLSIDWHRRVGGREVVRRSQLVRREAPEGLRVLFSTLVDVGQPDGTIARLPASYRLWYPSDAALEALVREADLAVELTYGSHELEPLNAESDRRIIVARRADGVGAG